jgi:hypothetical protein
MQEFVQMLDDHESLLPYFAITVGILFAGFCLILSAIVQVTRAKATEQSRREIAAYVAEGTMTPQEGERLMAAGQKPDEA